jgi:hypothetical protein
MDLRAELLSVLAQELTRCRSCRPLALFSLSLSLLLCLFTLFCSPLPGPPFILKGIQQLPDCMCDRCHTTLGGGVALQG